MVLRTDVHRGIADRTTLIFPVPLFQMSPHFNVVGGISALGSYLTFFQHFDNRTLRAD